ncbi:hypothetical protein TNCV_3458021 [Trichonephila clavipes]|nr:hypothetical protein TNCV_3458021 [Trichonephila clavipes]
MATLLARSQSHQCMESRACTTLDSLKQSLLREWDRLKVKDLRPIVKKFCKRLHICIAANGSHFEAH